jgi:hypothetical protein
MRRQPARQFHPLEVPGRHQGLYGISYTTMDLFSQLPSTPLGNDSIWDSVDCPNKIVHFQAAAKTGTASEVARVLHWLVARLLDPASTRHALPSPPCTHACHAGSSSLATSQRMSSEMKYSGCTVSLTLLSLIETHSLLRPSGRSYINFSKSSSILRPEIILNLMVRQRMLMASCRLFSATWLDPTNMPGISI